MFYNMMLVRTGVKETYHEEIWCGDGLATHAGVKSLARPLRIASVNERIAGRGPKKIDKGFKEQVEYIFDKQSMQRKRQRKGRVVGCSVVTISHELAQLFL